MKNNQPVYMHEFLRPTLDQIISEGQKRIDEAVERVCAKYTAPQIEVDRKFVPHVSRDWLLAKAQAMENLRYRGMMNSLLGMADPRLMINASSADTLRIVDNVFVSAAR